MSGRYIDEDALWMDIIHAMDYCEDILQIIESQPPADVRPNVHGEWLHEQLIPNTIEGKMYGECSVCHKVRIVDNFCPNCGANMRKEGKE